MRLWSLNPSYLDTQGLLAVWREALLAKHVLEGRTAGYKNHPQLIRFKESSQGIEYINSYLYGIYLEAKSRGYNFSLQKIDKPRILRNKIKVTQGQLDYEYAHLLNKLKTRDIDKYKKIENFKTLQTHYLFRVIPGVVEKWEKIKKI